MFSAGAGSVDGVEGLVESTRVTQYLRESQVAPPCMLLRNLRAVRLRGLHGLVEAIECLQRSLALYDKMGVPPTHPTVTLLQRVLDKLDDH